MGDRDVTWNLSPNSSRNRPSATMLVARNAHPEADVSKDPSYIACSVDFAALPAETLGSMVAAGEAVIETHRVLAKTDDNIVGELIRDAETFYEWDHYPDGDVYDHETHSQFYYHAHPQELRGGEHGHFHTFLRPLGMPKGIRPAALPDYKRPKGKNDALSHLVAISMDSHGIPIRLFTTNRWVTGEIWYAAKDVRTMLPHFDIDHAQPSWPVNRWIGAMLRLFEPQIVELLTARDARITGWTATHPDVNVYEDRDLEIASALDISVDDQLSAAVAALETKR